MTSVTLGGRMKKMREHKGLEQTQLVDRIEVLKRTEISVDETIRREKLALATLSRWENDHRNPSSGYVHLLARALEVNYEEEIWWLGLAGHLAPTPIPTKKQIKSILEVYYKEIQNDIFPSLIVDHRNNIWAINPAAAVFVDGYEQAVTLMEGPILNLFSLFFNSKLGSELEVELRTDLTKIEGLRKQQVLLFMMTNLYRRHEPFWQTYPECWSGLLPLNDYYQFEAMWTDISKEYFDSFDESSHFIQKVIDYTYVDFQIGVEKTITFKVLAETPSYFANNFFQVLHYVLVNEKDRPEAEIFFQQFQGKDTSKLRKWEKPNVDEILAEYI